MTGPLGSNHSDPVRNWALAGHGIVLLSSWDIAEKLKDGSVERVLPQYRQSVDVYAVMPTRASHLAKLSVCVDFLVKHLTQGPYALDTAILSLSFDELRIDRKCRMPTSPVRAELVFPIVLSLSKEAL